MEYKQIGVIAKPHGLKGEVAINLEGFTASEFQGFSTIFLEQFGSKVPYIIQNVDILKYDRVKVKLTNCDSVENAEKLRSLLVFQDIAELNELDILDFVGFKLFDQNRALVGVVEELIENSAQDLLVVKLKGKEIMVPLDEDLVQEIDEERLKIVMEIPEGLLDL